MPALAAGVERGRDCGTREHAALHRREIFADGLLHFADAPGERIEIMFRDAGQHEHHHQMAQVRGERLRERGEGGERAPFFVAVETFATGVVDEQNAPRFGERLAGEHRRHALRDIGA